MALLQPFQNQQDEPHPLHIEIMDDGSPILRNAPAKTRITFAELATYPALLHIEGPPGEQCISVNAANGIIVYAVTSVSNARGWYECDKIIEMELE